MTLTMPGSVTRSIRTNMKNSVKVSSLRLFLQSPERLGVLVSQVTKHSESDGPVRAVLHGLEAVQVTPPEWTAHVILCSK